MTHIPGILLRSQNKKVYATVLTILWIFVMVTFSFDWQYHRTAFVIDNDSPSDIAQETINDDSNTTLLILDNLFAMCCNLLADGLLVRNNAKP